MERKRILLAGATGTIGTATANALVKKGYNTVCLVRPGRNANVLRRDLQDVDVREVDVTDPKSLKTDGLRGDVFDAVISCLASRTGVPSDAWAIDHDANLNLLEAAQETHVRHFVLLSAICVQKPKLGFQEAKLAFEEKLQAAPLTYSIVRPTAFFKSLSGQLNRLKAGKPFLLFGDGYLTACKPISDEDLAQYLVGCLCDEALHNKILPIGGPGPALSPRQQGEALFEALALQPKFRGVSPRGLDFIVMLLNGLRWLHPSVRDKAELVRIGRYYATESMLVWDPATASYNADATPEFGSDTLSSFYHKLAAGEQQVELGNHKMF